MCGFVKVFCSILTNLTLRLCAYFADFCHKSSCNEEPADYCGVVDVAVAKEVEEFYKEVSREAAENLLKNKQNGTFIIRPSKNSNLGTLSVIQDNKMFHLGIRRRKDDGLIALGSEKIDEKSFKSIDQLIDYYISNYLVLYSNLEETPTLLLPYRELKF